MSNIKVAFIEAGSDPSTTAVITTRIQNPELAITLPADFSQCSKQLPSGANLDCLHSFQAQSPSYG